MTTEQKGSFENGSGEIRFNRTELTPEEKQLVEEIADSISAATDFEDLPEESVVNWAILEGITAKVRMGMDKKDKK